MGAKQSSPTTESATSSPQHGHGGCSSNPTSSPARTGPNPSPSHPSGSGQLHGGRRHHHHPPHASGASTSGVTPGVGGGSGPFRSRARSLNTMSGPVTSFFSMSSMFPSLSPGPDEDSSNDEDQFAPSDSGGASSAIFTAHSLPVHMIHPYAVIKCPICSKTISSDDVECHIVMCLTKPRISYNDDILTENKGECVICFDDLTVGDPIARLPCLCIYHKRCIDSWFEVNRSCPEHPSD